MSMTVELFTMNRHDDLDGIGVYGIRTRYKNATVWWRWCYARKDHAGDVASRLTIDSAQDFAANWVDDKKECALSGNEQDYIRRAMR